MKLKTLLIPLALSACATASGDLRKMPVGINNYCQIAKPIGYDFEKDTADTVKAIEAHNSAWVCVCENDCPQ